MKLQHKLSSRVPFVRLAKFDESYELRYVRMEIQISFSRFDAEVYSPQFCQASLAIALQNRVSEAFTYTLDRKLSEQKYNAINQGGSVIQ